jgi:hypothetical protein
LYRKGERLVHKRTAVFVAAALAVALVGVVAWRVLGTMSAYEQAVATMPASTLRINYTDWSQVRRLASGTSLGSSPSRHDVAAFLNRAYNLDLTAASAVSDQTYPLLRFYGFSPLDAEWEIYGQSRQGSVDVLQLDSSVDLSTVAQHLRSLGYKAPPGGGGPGGTWAGSSDLVVKLSGGLTPVQQNVALLPDQHLVLMSDSAAYASSATQVVTGSRPSVTGVDGVTDMAAEAKDPVSSVMWASDFACEDLAMSQAGVQDQRAAAALMSKAGSVSPLSGLVMAMQPDRSMVIGMRFETSDEASANLQPRVNLASGPAPGQGGGFPGRFTILEAHADGQNVVMHVQPRRRESLLSDISEGPVLFATC